MLATETVTVQLEPGVGSKAPASASSTRAKYRREQRSRALPANDRLYRAHPELRVGEPTWRWLKFGIELRDRLASPGPAERIRCPLSIVAAGSDRVVHNGPIRNFIARVPRGRFVEVPGAFHEILMETDVQRARFFEAFDRLAEELTAQRAATVSA